MNIFICSDSFKGSLSSAEAGSAIARGAKNVFEESNIVVKPIGDGGEGTMTALVSALDGVVEKAVVSGPLGEKITAEYGIINGSTAVIEMSAAAGLTLIPENKRDPLYTSTVGVGELILSALDKGCRRFIIGIGGSGTNDGGVGCLQALGFSFTDKNGEEIKVVAEGLKDLWKIDIGRADKRLSRCKFEVACDVNNPLCGENGCSAVFAPQKGADRTSIELMDKWLVNFARKTREVFPDSNPCFPGSGAAGGMGFSLKYYLNAKLTSGIDLVMKLTGIEEQIRKADIVVTGEGRLDGQSISGKVPAGVGRVAKKYGKTVIAICGCVGDGADKCLSFLDAYFPIVRNLSNKQNLLEPGIARNNLEDTSKQVFRLIKTIEQKRNEGVL